MNTALALYETRLRYYQLGEISFLQISKCSEQLCEAEIPVYGARKAYARHIQRLGNIYAIEFQGRGQIHAQPKRDSLIEFHYMKLNAELKMMQN